MKHAPDSLTSVCPEWVSAAVTDKPMHPGLKWAPVFTNESTLPEFTKDDVLRCIGVVMRRLDYLEQECRIDSDRTEELVKENKALKCKVDELQKAMKDASKGALYCKDIPPYNPSSVWNPRTMTMAEDQWMQETLASLKENDVRLQEIIGILGIVPDAEGKVEIKIRMATPAQQWMVYYYLAHKKIYKRYNRRPRGQVMQEASSTTSDASSSLFNSESGLADVYDMDEYEEW